MNRRLPPRPRAVPLAALLLAVVPASCLDDSGGSTPGGNGPPAGADTGGGPGEPDTGPGLPDGGGEPPLDGGSPAADGGEGDAGSETGDAASPSYDIGPEVLWEGERDPILLTGHLLTPDEEFPEGAVLFVRDRILCAGTGCDGGRYAAAAAMARRVETGGYVLPGLIDAHNHTSWNTHPRQRLSRDCYNNRDEWRGEPTYRNGLSARQSQYASAAYCEITKYGELKALLAGTTMTQGATRDEGCLDTLVRNMDAYTGFEGDDIEARISRVNPRTSPEEGWVRDLRARMDAGLVGTWLVHLAEGIDEYAREEFDGLVLAGLLRRETVIIHGTALGPAEFQRMAQAGAKLVFSPLSNVTLYGRTTDVVAARAAGVSVSLAPDWTPSGGENLLQELRFFDRYNREVLRGAFSDQEVVEMVTTEPAFAAGFEQRLGRLRRNFSADILVLRSGVPDPRRALLEARIEQVALVVVGGRALYGDEDLMAGLAYPACEHLDVCGVPKTICVREENPDPALGTQQGINDIVNTVRRVNDDPIPLFSCDPTPPEPFCRR